MSDVDGRVDAALAELWLEPSPRRLPSLQLDVVEAMRRLSVPGVGIAVVAEGEVAAVRAVGERDFSGALVREETMFQAGSISKSVAAVVALRLVAERQLELDGDVNDVLTSWRVPERRGWQARLTLRQLLSHTAGVTVHGFPGYPRVVEPPCLRDVLEGTPATNTPPIVTRILPGTQFSYSGGGYCIMQQLLEDATATSFDDLAHQTVLGPLGMDDSTFEQPLPEELHCCAASGHRTGGRPVEGGWNVYPEQAAAGLWTTPRDLARFVTAIGDGQRGHPGAILPADLVDEMLTAHATNVAYGLGVQLGDSPSSSWFFHGGDTEGFVAQLVGLRDTAAGVVVMTNSDRGGLLASAIVDAVARAMRWSDFSLAWTASDQDSKPISKVDTNRLVGTYETPNGMRFQVIATEGGVAVAVDGQDPVALRKGRGPRWVADTLDIEATFEGLTNGAELAASLTIAQPAPYTEPIVAFRHR
jgi:CubicO group peptidase (beta-lactamase class C family)